MPGLGLRKTCKCGCSPRVCHCSGGPSSSNGNGNGGGPNWPPQQVGSFLVIRYDAADVGARPIPSGDVWWVSPDIWVEGGDGLGNPVSGQPCTVNARIWNMGALDAMQTTVMFSYIEPGLAIPLDTPQPINLVPVYALVPNGSFSVVSVPWTPPAASGNVHTCLIATCSCFMTGDIPNVPGSAVADRHTAQRNVTLIGDGSEKLIKLSLVMRNLFPEDAELEIGARALWLTPRVPMQHFHQFDPQAAAGAIRAINRSNMQKQFRLLSRRAAMLLNHAEAFEVETLSKSDVQAAVKVTHIAPGHRLKSGAIVPPRGRADGTTAAIAELGKPVPLKSLQQAQVDYEVSLPAADHTQRFFVVHLFQMTNGAVDGGYTIVREFGGRVEPAPRRGKAKAAERRP